MDFFRRANRDENLTEDQKVLHRNFESIIQYFHSVEPTRNSPYQDSLEAYRNVEQSAKSHEELMYFLTSDIIFTALHTTVIEEMFTTIKNNAQYSIELIKKFSEDTQERDNLINDHTTNHLRFLDNGGFCQGCESCEGHNDIIHLIPHWRKLDLNYFTNLYLEVQTIYCFLERIIYELIPNFPDIAFMMTPELIMKTRMHLANYINQKLTEV